MIKVNFEKVIKESVAISLISFMTLATGFSYLEPIITDAVTDTHTVKQTITAEITFYTAATDVIMSPDLASITGGTSNGGTQFVIVSTNDTGFTVTLNTDSDTGMDGEDTTGTIPPFIPFTPGVPYPDFFSAPANSAAFGYTVEASTTSDLDPSFLDVGVVCNVSGGFQTSDTCWIDASTTPYLIINRSTATEASGATSTIKYRVIISANPDPAIPEDIYTATTTLTATNN